MDGCDPSFQHGEQVLVSLLGSLVNDGFVIFVCEAFCQRSCHAFLAGDHIQVYDPEGFSDFLSLSNCPVPVFNILLEINLFTLIPGREGAGINYD